MSLREGEWLLREGLRARLVARPADGAGPPGGAPPGPISEAALKTATDLALESRTLPLFEAGVAPWLSPQARAGLARLTARFKKAAMARQASMLARAGSIVELLEGADIPVVLFKGPLLQKQLYRDPFLRPSGDLDLLVRRPDYGRAVQALRGAGFVRRGARSVWWDVFLGESHLAVPGAPWTVDLHHALQQPGLPSPRDTAAFVETRADMIVAGARLPVIAPHLVPLVSAMNLAKALFHRDRAAPHACDLMTALGGGADPEPVRAFEQSAAAQGVAGTAALALRVLGAVFGVDMRPAGGAGAAPLAAVDDATLSRMTLAPQAAGRWPRRRDISAALCRGGRAERLRVGLWYLGSEAARVLVEGKARRGDAPGAAGSEPPERDAARSAAGQ